MRPLIFAMTAVAGLTLTGCGGSEFPATVLVTGIVNHQGKPVEGATVTLVPTDQKGKSASGISDAEGKFSVKTFFGADHNPEGALPGDYLVAISKNQVLKPPSGMTQWEEQAWFTKQGPPKALLPKQYSIPEKSGLTLTVGNSSPEPLTYDLKD